MDSDGCGVDVRVTGYQFPDATDPQKRFSWHMLEGEGFAPQGSWRFRYPALTCDETPHISTWLRKAATDNVADLSFTEPNLVLRVAGRSADRVTMAIELDLEFSPPWQRTRMAGDPHILTLQLPPHTLTAAASAWDQETALFPDGLA